METRQPIMNVVSYTTMRQTKLLQEESVTRRRTRSTSHSIMDVAKAERERMVTYLPSSLRTPSRLNFRKSDGTN